MQFGVLLAIAVGGAAGSLARHFLSSSIYGVTGSAFPYGILVVNVLGGLIMGIIVELGALKLNYTMEMRAFLTTGMLGGFTTFSTFSLDSALLIERGDWAGAAIYMIASVLLSVGALFAGLWLVRSFA
ncbi:MAG TPA: fluoride efflux transporter CrcB [Micropepsaceae bacterium]|jgi:CrcB protein|nr:fluoride efflux transporter CrcB [Micropepsaceae bacterium]